MTPYRWYHRVSDVVWAAVFAIAGAIHERKDPRYREGGPR